MSDEEKEVKPMSVKERMKMFNKKKTFKVETSYDAIRRQKKERIAAKKAKADALSSAAKRKGGGTLDSVADAHIRASADQRKEADSQRKKAADDAANVKYSMSGIADAGTRDTRKNEQAHRLKQKQAKDEAGTCSLGNLSFLLNAKWQSSHG